MKQSEYAAMKAVTSVPTILYLNHFSAGLEKIGTLLYGYDCDRRTYHLYLSPPTDAILLIYNSSFEVQYAEVFHGFIASNQFHVIIPNKRLYPARCNYQFCRKLKEMGAHMSFTNYSEEEQKAFVAIYGDIRYYGQTQESLVGQRKIYEKRREKELIK